MLLPTLSVSVLPTTPVPETVSGDRLIAGALSVGAVGGATTVVVAAALSGPSRPETESTWEALSEWTPGVSVTVVDQALCEQVTDATSAEPS